MERGLHSIPCDINVRMLLLGSQSLAKKAQQRQLNGFHARCLRDIQRIPHPQESRISNQVVLERAGQVELSRQLLKRQLTLFGRIARAPDSDQRRQLTFCPGTLRLVADRFVRRVGRPRLEWAGQLLSLATSKLGSAEKVHSLTINPVIWRQVIEKHF